MRPWLKACWTGTRFCSHCVCTFLLWCVWLILGVTLGVQIYIACVHRLALPDWIARRVESASADFGIRVTYDHAEFDPGGHVVVRNFTLAPRNLAEPLVTARAVRLELDPWALLVGRLSVSRVHFDGGALRLPAMLSTTGRNEPVLDAIDLELRPDGRHLAIDTARARLGRLTLTARGALTLPPPRRQHLPLDELIRLGVANYLSICRRVALVKDRLAPLEGASADIVLTPVDPGIAIADLELRADALDLAQPLPGLPALPKIAARQLVLTTRAPLVPRGLLPLRASVSLASLDAPPFASVRQFHADLGARLDPRSGQVEPGSLQLQAASVTAHDLTTFAPVLAVTPIRGTDLAVDLATYFSDSFWHARFEGDPRAGRGDASLAGLLTPSLVDVAGHLSHHDFAALLQFEHPATFEAGATFDGAWHPAAASGRAAIGTVVARDVALDRAGASFFLSGDTLRCDDLVLAQGPSLARGSYEMNTRTRDFRFLLDGTLVPSGISGWFRSGWWEALWDHFQFTHAPAASVDIQGRWGAPHQSAVFVAAHGDDLGLHHIHLDHIDTRVFVRPGWTDVLAFHGTQGHASTRGRFTRTFDVDSHEWKRIDFDADSTLPLADTARLIGDFALPSIEPYEFTRAPTLHAAGRVEGPGSPDGEHQTVDLTVATDGPFTFFKFPLDSVNLSAHVRDDVISVPESDIGFASGHAIGHATLTGRGDARRLAFDYHLRDAILGRAIHALENYGAASRSAPPVSKSSTRFQQKIAAGRLELVLAAEGPADTLYAFHGKGRARLAAADLGEINLLGALSQVLKSAGLGFTSLKLDTAATDFSLVGDHLEIPDLVVTGPSAKIEAHGTYALETKGLDLRAKVSPFESSQGFWGNTMDLVFTPFSAALEVKLGGVLDDPKWIFVFGPTNLLRNLTGSGDKPLAPPPAPAPAPSTPPAAKP